MNYTADLALTAADHAAAFTEVAFLLDIFATTIDDLMGGAVAPVGRVAGRHMARKLPVHLVRPSLAVALEQAARGLKRGFEIRTECQAREARLAFGRCAVREACQTQRREPGGALCRLFHAYLDGVVNEMVSSPVKSTIEEMGSCCLVSMRMR